MKGYGLAAEWAPDGAPGVLMLMPLSTRPARRVPLLALLALLLPIAASAQADPTALNEALRAAQRDHLWRVAAWGGASLAAGLAFAATAGDSHATRKGFGVQTAAWGAINLGIVAWGFAGDGGAVATDLASALRAEDRWTHLLLVNLGLNVGYMAVGSALWVASGRGLRSGDAVRGHAMAVVVQGLALLALDGWAWRSSADRMSSLVEAIASLEVAAAPMSGSVSLGWSLPFPG